MSEFFSDYWPLLVVAVVGLASIFAAELIGWHRGRLAGRAEIHREMRHAQKGGRL